MQSFEAMKERSARQGQEQRKKLSAVRSPESEVPIKKQKKWNNQFDSRRLVVASSASPVGDDLNYLTPPKPDEMESEDERLIMSNAKSRKLHKKYSNPFLAK